MACFPDVWAPIQLSYCTCVLSAIIGFIAMFGNINIIIAVVKNPLKKLHTPFNYFLINLAFSDLIVGGITMPISTYNHYAESIKNKPRSLVKALHVSFFISVTASLLSLVALSVDRYIAITWAIKYRQYLSWSRCVKVSIGIWLVSCTLPLIYIKIGFINYLMVYACSAILTGLAVMVAIYLRIYLFLRAQTRELKQILRSSSTAAEEFHLKRLVMEKKVTRVFLVILFVYVFTYVPATILIFILHFCESCDCTVRHVFRDFSFLLISFNSCVNPFICTIRLKHFRQSISSLYRKCFQRTQVSKRSAEVRNTDSSDV